MLVNFVSMPLSSVGGDERSGITSVTSAYDTHTSDTASEALSEQDSAATSSGIGSLRSGRLERLRRRMRESAAQIRERLQKRKGGENWSSEEHHLKDQ